MTDNSKTPSPKEKLSTRQIISSVLAAAIGVQSNRNRERDFTQARPTTFIIAGIIFTLIFILSLVVLVKVILNNAV